MLYSSVKVRVWGDLACFTRPEMKVERVTYPVMTPSAARGILEAIFWKPEFFWIIDSISVLKPIRYFSVVRNEIKDRQNPLAQGYFADDPNSRTQRHTLGLRDVDYLISARIALRPNAGMSRSAYADRFIRRVKKGRCYHRPYLGCREFSAAFAPPAGTERPIKLSGALGPMLLDLYAPDGAGEPTPVFFEARLEDGVLYIPRRTETNSAA